MAIANEYRIYIIDDNEGVRLALSKVFQAAGFEVCAYASATEFLENFKPRPNSGILLDLRMPGISGLELLRTLKERDWIFPVIIYTAYADVEATVQAFSDGVYTVIQKPTSNNLLIDKVKEAISKHQNSLSLRQSKLDAETRLNLLTKREHEIALLLAEGKSAPSIGKIIHISARTVETHRRNIFLNLNINSVAELSRIVTLARLKL